MHYKVRIWIYNIANLKYINRLLLLLAKLSAGISGEEFARLEAALTPVIHTEQEQVKCELLKHLNEWMPINLL